MSMLIDDLSGNIFIPPRNKMSGMVQIIAIGEEDVDSSLTVKQIDAVQSHIDVYSDYVIEDIAFPPRLGYQKRSNLYVSHREDLSSNIRITPKNKMTGLIEIIQPPRTVVELNPVKDAFIRESAKTLNYGTEQTMLVGYSDNFEERYRSFIEFELSSIPQDVIIEKAILKMHNAGSVESTNEIGLYQSTSPWEEIGVTWNNQPSSGSLIETIIVSDKSRTTEVDITDTILKIYNHEITNNGFILKAIDEELRRVDQFFTRESVSDKPILEIQYYDDKVFSFGRSEVNSSIFVNGVGSGEISGSISITEFNSDTVLPSSIHVLNPDFLELSITVSSPELITSIQVKRHDAETLDGSLTVKRTEISETEGLLTISSPMRRGRMIVPHRNEIEAGLTVRATEEDSVLTSLAISRPYISGSISIPSTDHIFGSINIKRYEEWLAPGNIAVSKPIINGRIIVRQNGSSAIPSKLIVAQKDGDDVNASIAVSRVFLNGSITVLASEHLPGNIKVNQFEYFNCSIHIPERNNVQGSIDVIHAYMLPGSINVLSDYFRGSIRIPAYESFDITSSIEVQARWIDEINGRITVGGEEIQSGYVFIL